MDIEFLSKHFPDLPRGLFALDGTLPDGAYWLV